MLVLDNEGTMKLLKACYKECFVSYPIIYFRIVSNKDALAFLRVNNDSVRNISSARLNFANSKLLQMFCDCSDAHEFGKCQKAIIKAQVYFMKEAEEKINKKLTLALKQYQAAKYI